MSWRVTAVEGIDWIHPTMNLAEFMYVLKAYVIRGGASRSYMKFQKSRSSKWRTGILLLDMVFRLSRGHSMRCRTKKSSNSVCRKPHQSLSCHCIPISTLPHVVSAAFWPWKMEQTRVHQWLDPNTTFDHHFQHLHIFHIHWFIHLSFSRLRVEWARFEGFTEWVVKGLEWFQDFLGLQVVKWGQECERAEWQQVLHFFDFYSVSPTSTLGKKNENCPLGLHEKYMRRAQTWEFFVSLLGWFSDPFKGFWWPPTRV